MSSKKMFTKSSIYFKEEEEENNKTKKTIICIHHGYEKYFGLVTEFSFDEDGKLTDISAYE